MREGERRSANIGSLSSGSHWLHFFTLIYPSNIGFPKSEIMYTWTYPHVKYKGDLQRIGRNLLHPLFGSVE